MNGIDVRKSERGFALVVAMLVLLVLTLLGLIIMSSVVMNRGMVGNDQRLRQSLNIAEAGVGEAMSRIRNQETGMAELAPNAVCQVFNTVPGSVPVLGTDSIALATGQAAGTQLAYTTAGRSGDELTIAWKKNAAGTKVMRFDPVATPTVNENTGLPIYVITSTGRVGTTRRTVTTEVIQKPFTVLARGALAANVPINFVGNAYICGFNHYGSTHYDDGKNGRNSGPGGPYDCVDNERNDGTDLAGAWSTGSIFGVGASGATGNPNFAPLQPGFYAGPWEAFGLTQAEWWSWIGTPVATPPDINGIYYVDNNTTTQDFSGGLALHSVDGEGFLYIDGDLTCNAGFHYKGLLYVEGNLSISGQAWILGGLIVRGHTEIQPAGGMTILYSSEAIMQAIAKYGQQFVTLNWREK